MKPKARNQVSRRYEHVFEDALGDSFLTIATERLLPSTVQATARARESAPYTVSVPCQPRRSERGTAVYRAIQIPVLTATLLTVH